MKGNEEMIKKKTLLKMSLLAHNNQNYNYSQY